MDRNDPPSSQSRRGGGRSGNRSRRGAGGGDSTSFPGAGERVGRARRGGRGTARRGGRRAGGGGGGSTAVPPSHRAEAPLPQAVATQAVASAPVQQAQPQQPTQDEDFTAAPPSEPKPLRPPPPQQQDSPAPLLTPLKASAPEFRPSTGLSPSPGPVSLSAAQERSSGQSHRTSTPDSRPAPTASPDTHIQGANRALLNDPGTSHGASRYEHTFVAQTVLDDVEAVRYATNRRSTPPQGGPRPLQGRGGGGSSNQYTQPLSQQTSMGGTWYPPRGMPPAHMMADPSAAGHVHQQAQMGYFYPSPADPWMHRHGGGPDMTGMGGYGIQGGPQYMPHHALHMQGQQGHHSRMPSGSHRLHSDAPTFTPAYPPPH